MTHHPIRSLQRTILRATLAILSLVVLTVGCSSPDTVMAPHTPPADPLPEGAYPNVVLLDDLQQVLVREQPNVTPASDIEPMRVRVPIRSVVDTNLNLEYRFIFYNDDRDQLTRNPTWQPLVLPRRVRRYVQANAIQLAATYWELEIRKRRIG